VISYRSLKKLIGETSLERKCRFLFGIALLFLITGSFWWYAVRTQQLVEQQQVLAARMMVPRVLQLQHYTRFLERSRRSAGQTAPPLSGETAVSLLRETVNDTAGSSRTVVNDDPLTEVAFLRKVMASLPSDSDRASWDILSPKDSGKNDVEYEARRRFNDRPDAKSENEYFEFVPDDGKRKLYYYSAVRIQQACIVCHLQDGSVPERMTEEQLKSLNSLNGFPGTQPEASDRTGIQPADSILRESVSSADSETLKPLHAIVGIELSLEAVDFQLAQNRAVLLATGIITAFLAMLAAYVIVRYIIVKPVQHLKEVSDEIARGNLNLRADISTGDEFEELSHAFNRMLRHMMTGNDELRTLNESLDGKIDQLAQANMELFNNNRLKDDFLATISHELRTPLNSILGFSDILQTAPNLDDRQRRYVSNIQTSGQSLMVQINDLLDLAKIESGKMDIHPSRFGINEILEIQVQQIMPLADRKNIDLRMDPSPEPLPMLSQDQGKISQIANNLLSNAIKFTPEGGRVRVASRLADDGFISFSVEDTGIGIPLQEQEHIFEKFRQGSTSPGGRDHTKREYEGTGLGLSIVRELSRLLGGDVSLRSEFGRGSLFQVRIPVELPLRAGASEPLLESRPAPPPPLITTSDLVIGIRREPVPPGRILIDVQSIGH
jgi:signal transduction histidine kinase